MKKSIALNLLLGLVLATFVSHNVTAQQQDQKIRALFVLKFIENVSWPEDKKSLVIGVLGKDDIYTELENRLQAKNPNGIIVKKISAADVAACDVVYVPSADTRLMGQINNQCQGKGVLIISETDLSKKGSGISFVDDGGRLSFIVNKNAIESHGLKVSSTLLSLGRQV
jgi:hypothetical protein